jgi:hypothetical protein
MKNAPVVVIRNRDSKRSEKYRIRNLITGTISYSNSVTLIHPVVIPNVDLAPNLGPERVVSCNWAFSGSLASYEDVRRMSNKTPIKTDEWGFELPGGKYYYEENFGSLKALHLSDKAENRFVWLAKK